MPFTPARRSFFVAAGTLATSSLFPLPLRAAETYTLRMGLGDVPTGIAPVTGVRFAAAVGRRSKGQLNIEVYPNGQLTKQEETFDAIGNGTLDMTINATTLLTLMLPQFQIFDTPFLFKTPAGTYRVFDGPVGVELFAALEPKGIVGLGWATSGFRQFETTTKAVVVPDDMRGLRMRIPPGAIYAAMFEALGSIPVTIDRSEIYTALIQHTLEGQDNPLGAFITSKFYMVSKRVAMSRHINNAQLIAVNKRKLEGLPSNLQTIMREEAHSAAAFMRNLAVERDNAAVQFLKGNGVSFTEIQYAPFRKAMDPVYALIQSKVGSSLLDRVVRAASAG